MTGSDVLALLTLFTLLWLAGGGLYGARKGAWDWEYTIPILGTTLIGVFFLVNRFAYLHGWWVVGFTWWRTGAEFLNQLSAIWRLFTYLVANGYIILIFRHRMYYKRHP